jgi:putative ATP-dependent endonuclease of the OLD family
MRLAAITTKNYRTLEDITLQFSADYCTVSGRNNAGKSCVIRLLSGLFRPRRSLPWSLSEGAFDYDEDKTQWVKDSVPIEVTYLLTITRDEDPALVSFIERIADKKIDRPDVSVSLKYDVDKDDDLTISVTVDGEPIDAKAAKEIDKRIKDSQILFLYNSTVHQEEFYFTRGRPRMFYDFIMSAGEKKDLDEAGKAMEKQLRKLAKEHMQGLSEVLGRLADKYDVELSPPESFTARRMPLVINLRDQNVLVPLDDWGSGTQNRTHILMAVLQANRIKKAALADDKITPFVVIEEPESFLHPSAQAEFGKMLRHLSIEFEIQIIVTTHSPHMLNQGRGEANILLARRSRRGKAFETYRIDTGGNEWMAPFADHLGINAEEFSRVRSLFSADKSQVLLVEGQIDVEYFEFMRDHSCECEKLLSSIEVVPYGGKDTLKNTLLVQFVLRKFDRVFITYDLDAQRDVNAALTRAGLIESQHAPLGISQPGKDCIEGLLPKKVLSAVMARETDLVMQLSSTNDRKRAKDELKKRYLAEFRSRSDYTKDDLKQFNGIIKRVNAWLAPNARQIRTIAPASMDTK